MVTFTNKKITQFLSCLSVVPACFILPYSFATSYSSAGHVRYCDSGRGIEVTVPIVKTFEELRDLVKWFPPQPIGNNGKIVIYGNYLLVNEPDKGIHIFDNQDPTNPVPKGFVNIPGNNDFMVKDDIIYAESLKDLVLIDMKDINTVEEVGRSRNLFTVNRYRFSSLSDYYFDIDTTNEIIIGEKTVCVEY